ncbi:MAG: alpha/beta hydrolase-fold protein, partial [Verrucomicrobiota bacterium]
SSPLRVVGQGRSPTEKLFRADGIAASGAEMEFIFSDGSQWLNAPAPPSSTAQGAAPAIPYPYQGLSAPYNFRTSLDVFFVQDQQIFNYTPPSALSAPRFAYWQIHSTVAGIPERWITVRLPRGYDENTWKKYPVVYFHDGQNVFFPGGPYGTWDTDRIADYEIGQGRMRECVIVSIPNGNDLGSNRLNEYLPDGDTITNYGGLGVNYVGRAASYRKFLLDNLLPTLDYHFRTFGDAANTLVAGSSMGGLVSDYIGITQSDRFGTVGIFSPAYWAAPNYMGSRTVPATSPRAYVYMGTAESSSGKSSSDVYWQGALNAYNSFLRAGRVANRSLLFEGGAGAQHNEPAWSRHLPAFFAFALNPWLEANPLALASFPPHLDLQSLDPAANKTTLRHLALYGFHSLLQSSENLTDWTGQPLAGAENPWDLLETVDSAPAAQKRFWRVRTTLP